jgi:glycosyltransferase involved in cell wall biosynthesis
VTRRLRIAIPLAGFNPSGGVQSLIHLANGLVERGHRVRMVVPDFAAASPRAIHPSVQLRVVRTGRLPLRLRQVVYYARLLLESTQSADVCLANYWPTAYTAIVSKHLRDRHTQLAYNVRAYEPITHGELAESGRIGRRLRAAFAAGSYRLPLKKLVTSQYLRRMVRDPAAEVMGHGIDLATFYPDASPRANDQVTVGIIGRSGAVKGYEDFLAAMERVPPFDDLRVLVAATEAVRLPHGHQASIIAATSEAAMAAFYRMCDVFVFASRSEGFGLPAIEALASGCALLVTDCGGVREFACPDENCLMVPPADAPALARGLVRLLESPELRRRLSARGTEDAKHFSRDAVSARFEAALLTLTGDR